MFVNLWFWGDERTRGVKKWICLFGFLPRANFSRRSLSLKCHWRRKERSNLLMNKVMQVVTWPLEHHTVPQLFWIWPDCLTTEQEWSYMCVFRADVSWPMLVSAATSHILLCLWWHHSKIPNIMRTIRIREENLIRLVTKIQTNSLVILSS